jgi:DNA-binding LacI/PurR family transcriptional regulator
MATQRELAKHAGVSAGTVSNVISGSARVSEEARRKVLDAIRILKYQPNLIARSLRTNRTHTLGIEVPDLTIPFFPKIVRGAEAAARERGYFLIVLDSQLSHDLEIDMMALLRQRVDGILPGITSGLPKPPQRLLPVLHWSAWIDCPKGWKQIPYAWTIAVPPNSASGTCYRWDIAGLQFLRVH